MSAFREKEFYSVVLGALLHDIGIFVQRSMKEPSPNHPLLGKEWVGNNLSKKLTSIFSKEEYEIFLSGISRHHEDEEYISLADSISAGYLNRINLEDEERANKSLGPLRSIFSNVSLTDRSKKEKYHKLIALGKEHLKELFPVNENRYSSEEYLALLNSLEKEVEKIDFGTLAHLDIINVIYFLIWKYCWCIPSPTYEHEPYVPLFDHLRMSAAIAGCLYSYGSENPAVPLNVETKSFCLIGGDISGIQSYIFEVLTHQGKVAKRLRARSLFVQLISEITTHKILHAFGLPLCNVIMSAGGNFYILAPNLKYAKNIVDNLRKEFDRWTFDNLNAELFVSLESIEISGSDLINFSNTLDSLKASLNYKKEQPYKSILAHDGKWHKEEFVLPETIENEDEICRGCHKNPRKKVEQNEDDLCERCLDDVKIGQVLTKSEYIAFFRNNAHQFKILNYSFELWDGDKLKKGLKDEPYLILRLNNPDVKSPVTGFKYLSTHIPTDADIPQEGITKDQPVTFDDIARVSNGDKVLGYIKADADNMGKILREGFGNTGLSLSGYVAFSRMLETFFSGHLHIHSKTEYREIYTVFSGGDDFFIIGPWDKAIDFVSTMRREFYHFCADNPDLAFSAGVILAKPHEPLSYCTHITEAKLEDSKKQDGKDSITLFDNSLHWNELDKVIIEAKKIIEWSQKEPPVISRRSVHNFREYGSMAEKSGILTGEEKDTRYLKFVPLLTYDINRNLSKDYQKDAYTWAMELRPTVDKPQGGDNLPYLRTIMEYVLSYTRS